MAVFPCILQILENCVFRNTDPIIVGVKVVDGICKVGTPLCVPSRNSLLVGRILSVEQNHKPVPLARAGDEVAIKIENENGVAYGRHFEIKDQLVSKLSRNSIDALKQMFKDDLSESEWRSVIKIKKLLNIV